MPWVDSYCMRCESDCCHDSHASAPVGLQVDGQLAEMGDVQYLLSPQDLMAVEQVPALMRAGVACFKIEGRLKGAAYVALTTQVLSLSFSLSTRIQRRKS
jgi:collagenase-like PrtC family protease